jgi:hypothetical protein
LKIFSRRIADLSLLTFSMWCMCAAMYRFIRPDFSWRWTIL